MLVRHSYTWRPEKYTPFQRHIGICLYNGSYPPPIVGWMRKLGYHTSRMHVATPTDLPESVRNRFVIEQLGGVFAFKKCSVDVEAFVIRMCSISSFFS